MQVEENFSNNKSSGEKLLMEMASEQSEVHLDDRYLSELFGISNLSELSSGDECSVSLEIASYGFTDQSLCNNNVDLTTENLRL